MNRRKKIEYYATTMAIVCSVCYAILKNTLEEVLGCVFRDKPNGRGGNILASRNPIRFWVSRHMSD